MRKDLRLHSENEELISLFEYGMNAIRCDLIWDKNLPQTLVFPEITFGTLTVSARCRRSVLRGNPEDVGNRMQQGRELCIPIFLPVNFALRVSQAAGTYFEDCYLFCSRDCNPSALLSF